jgi:hypothetical protein
MFSTIAKGAFPMRERQYLKLRQVPGVRIGLGVVALLVAAFALILSGAQPTRASGGPAIQITPNSGPYHTVTVVTGQGFAPHEQVAIFKETRAFFAYETDGTGSFVGAPHPLIGPGPLSGIITITGVGRTSGLKATSTFTVTP